MNGLLILRTWMRFVTKDDVQVFEQHRLRELDKQRVRWSK